MFVGAGAFSVRAASSQTATGDRFDMVAFEPPVQAPEFTLNDLSGKPRSIGAAGETKFKLLNFWATWCPPCVHELPSLQTLYESMDPQRFSILAVSVDTEQNTGRIFDFRDRFGLKFPIVQDMQSEIANTWGAREFPSTFLVGPRGEILAAAKGERVWHSKNAIAYFNNVMDSYE